MTHDRPSYRSVLALSGARLAFLASSVARFGYAMFPLALILAVQDATGSYAAAGSCVGLFAVTSVLMPVKARAIDRYGQRLVLRVLGCGFFFSVAACAAFAQMGIRSQALYLVLSTLSGLAAPPVGPCMRALWAVLAPQLELRQRAYGLDSAVEEALYILGPAAVGGLVASASAGAPLMAVAVLNLAGAVAMAASRAAAQAATPQMATADEDRPPRRTRGPLAVPGFGVLVLVLFLIGAGTGPIDIAVLARAQQGGRPADAGWVLAAFAVGSLVGGLLWGRWRHRSLVSQQLAALVALTGMGLVAAGTAAPLPTTAACVAVAGLAMSPALIVAYVASDDLVPDGRRTEANTWVSTANNGGVALGSAGAGVVIDGTSTATALHAGATVLLVTAVCLLVAHRRLQPLKAEALGDEPVLAAE